MFRTLAARYSARRRAMLYLRATVPNRGSCYGLARAEFLRSHLGTMVALRALAHMVR